MLTISTADGVAEAIVATPPSGDGPGVLFFMDAFGLRPRIADMAAEIASWGHVVLAPNVFYGMARSTRSHPPVTSRRRRGARRSGRWLGPASGT